MSEPMDSNPKRRICPVPGGDHAQFTETTTVPARAIFHWPFGDLTPLAYNLVVADPPWSFKLRSPKGELKSPQHHYNCMDLAAIKALPVSQLAAPDCMLFLWATAPMLPQALEVMSAWGFKFKSTGAWHKKTRHGKTAFGPGYVVRSATEFFLLGTIGKPKTSRSHRNLIEGLAREHSRKPEESYRWAETYMPDARRAELFSRQQRPGWSSWGNEINKFSEAAA